ncbi:MAG: hypothetical protein EZS28_047340 [Streblomastix strix]|uniref:Uncharacterized protein n=1 Tax=Streblomastix strix TaxID=222440 RepID=A0A5J4TH64_9EUKA|nr:MAG: hypothetical protein EZS28_047340 [Streblomastix strix]
MMTVWIVELNKLCGILEGPLVQHQCQLDSIERVLETLCEDVVSEQKTFHSLDVEAGEWYVKNKKKNKKMNKKKQKITMNKEIKEKRIQKEF